MQRFISLLLSLSHVDSFSNNYAHFFLHGPTTASMPMRSPQQALTGLSATVDRSEEDQKMNSARSRYKADMDELHRLLDSDQQQTLHEMKRLIRDIQRLRRSDTEAALPRKVRDALAEYRAAETEYGAESREAKVAYEYFVDISHARDLHPDRHEENEGRKDSSNVVWEEALNAIRVLEELKEIAFVEKTILERFGTTDFEVGEGFLEREIGREDEDTYGLWV
ncbi:hypothetical protein ACHAWX_005636 [Stephanocyclus meneghinianus]